MDITDFDNTYKYKFFLPMLYVVNWALMLTGPFFYPAAYQYYCFAIFFVMGLKGVQFVTWNLFAVVKAVRLLNKAEKMAEKRKTHPTKQEI